jgi:hypothetical protein
MYGDTNFHAYVPLRDLNGRAIKTAHNSPQDDDKRPVGASATEVRIRNQEKIKLLYDDGY